MRSRLALLAILLTSGAVALPALAADPEEGTVGAGGGVATWSGSVLGDPTGAALDAMAGAGGTNGTCTPDTCDEFTLHVTHPGTVLEITITGKGGATDAVAVEVEDPSGATVFDYDADTEAVVTLDAPATGDYLIRTLSSPGSPDTAVSGVPYEGRAQLSGVAVATATPTVTAEPTQTAAPTATPEPTQAAPPPPPPRTLALQADRLRIKRAIAKGIRARTRCSGGCARVEVAAFVSPLTARRLGYGRVFADVAIARAKPAAGEGRAVHTLVIVRKVRRRLARMKRVDLAVEAVVTDADGRRRTAIDRLTLKR